MNANSDACLPPKDFGERNTFSHIEERINGEKRIRIYQERPMTEETKGPIWAHEGNEALGPESTTAVRGYLSVFSGIRLYGSN